MNVTAWKYLSHIAICRVGGFVIIFLFGKVGGRWLCIVDFIPDMESIFQDHTVPGYVFMDELTQTGGSRSLYQFTFRRTFSEHM